jgi:sporulation protein YlmC with PRC-barrel domain
VPDRLSPKINLKHAKTMLCAVVASTSIIGQAQVTGPAGLGVNVTELREVVTVGWSAKRQVLGEPVYNEKSERIGTVDDVVIAADMARSYAIIGVGAYLGTDKRDIVVRLSQLIRQVDGSFVLVGATKDALKALPPFEYAR